MSIMIVDGPKAFSLSQQDLELLQAYVNTSYELLIEQGGTSILLHAGEAYPHCLEQYQWQDGLAVLTAWNPASKPLSLLENRSRQKSLMNELRQDGFEHICRAIGRSRTESWSEESLGVFNMSLSKARHYGQKFGQYAVLWLKKEQKPKIVVCEPFWSNRGAALTEN
ncbi:MAG: DUF3293 domain-containing protein [Myxococcota bacterium]|nr:DUF3293 domain-containing protein [Myxococcota bacterium]